MDKRRERRKTQNSITRVLGDNLLKIRKKKGLKQSYVANKLGINQGRISEWETDMGTLGADDLYKLAEFYKVTTDFLFGIGPETRDPDIQTATITTGLSENAISFLNRKKTAVSSDSLNYLNTINDLLCSTEGNELIRQLTDLRLIITGFSYLNKELKELSVSEREDLEGEDEQGQGDYLGEKELKDLSDWEMEIKYRLLSCKDSFNRYVYDFLGVRAHLNKLEQSIYQVLKKEENNGKTAE